MDGELLHDVSNVMQPLTPNKEIEYDHRNSDNVPYTVVCAILILLIILGNGTILAIIIWRKELKTHRMIYIVSLVTSDLMVACIVIPLAISTQYQMFVMTSLVCKISECLKYLTVTANLYCVVAIATDRHQVIMNIFKSRPPNSRPALFVFFVWLFAAVYSIRPAFTHGLTTHEDDIQHHPHNVTSRDQQRKDLWNILESMDLQNVMSRDQHGNNSWNLLESIDLQNVTSRDQHGNNSWNLLESIDLQNVTSHDQQGNNSWNILERMDLQNVTSHDQQGNNSWNILERMDLQNVTSHDQQGNNSWNLLESMDLQNVTSHDQQGNDSWNILERMDLQNVTSHDQQGNNSWNILERMDLQNVTSHDQQGNNSWNLLESMDLQNVTSHDQQGNDSWNLLESTDLQNVTSFKEHSTCGLEIESLRHIVIILDFLVICLFPLLIITILYIRVILWLLRQRRNNCAVSRSKNQNVKLIRMVLIIVMTYTVCQLPSHIFLMYVYFGPGVNANAESIYDILTMFTYMNSVFNVCIYSLFDSRINTFVKILFCCDVRTVVADVPSVSQTPNSSRRVTTTSSARMSSKVLNTYL